MRVLTHVLGAGASCRVALRFSPGCVPWNRARDPGGRPRFSHRLPTIEGAAPGSNRPQPPMIDTRLADSCRSARPTTRALVAAAIAAAVACGAAAGPPAATAQPRTTTVKIVADFPLTGTIATRRADRPCDPVRAETGRLQGGHYRVRSRRRRRHLVSDDWDEGSAQKCTLVRRRPDVVGVIGAFDSGCSMFEIPSSTARRSRWSAPGTRTPA